MKMFALAAAGLAAAAAVAPAGAQTRTVTTHTVVRTHTGPAAHHTRQVCNVRYVHHRKVRTCRTVRY
jgi:succinate dehydrogenase/fumarate reductase flavoprotein subunit